jgi:hypothetical protein
VSKEQYRSTIRNEEALLRLLERHRVAFVDAVHKE